MPEGRVRLSAEGQMWAKAGRDKGEKCRTPDGTCSAPERRHTWLPLQLSWLVLETSAILLVSLGLSFYFHQGVPVNPGLTLSQ